jgi:hypothetical protein
MTFYAINASGHKVGCSCHTCSPHSIIRTGIAASDADGMPYTILPASQLVHDADGTLHIYPGRIEYVRPTGVIAEYKQRAYERDVAIVNAYLPKFPQYRNLQSGLILRFIATTARGAWHDSSRKMFGERKIGLEA